jgi:dihydrofolate reductase
LTPEWGSTTVVTGRAVDYVADLKAKPGRDIGIHGSLTLAQSLLGARLVDQLELVVSPVVAGRGRRLFPDSDGQQTFDLHDVQHTRNGSLLLSYQLAKSA